MRNLISSLNNSFYNMVLDYAYFLGIQLLCFRRKAWIVAINDDTEYLTWENEN